MGVGVGVGVDEGVCVGVRDGFGVRVTVGVGVRLGFGGWVGVGVGVCLGVGVRVGVGARRDPTPFNMTFNGLLPPASVIVNFSFLEPVGLRLKADEIIARLTGTQRRRARGDDHFEIAADRRAFDCYLLSGSIAQRNGARSRTLADYNCSEVQRRRK